MSEEAVKQETASSLFTVSVSPHIRDDETISHIMWQVNAALLPAALFAIWWFGIPALINMLVGVVDVSRIAALYGGYWFPARYCGG